MTTHCVYLVPGFFGFATIGDFRYFSHVEEYLLQALQKRGVRAEIHPVKTLPTSSLRRRAARLADTMTATAGGRPGPIHIIGHSTGGLDARLMVSPNVNLPTESPVEPLAWRVRSVVTVSTPHYGTPIASFFASLLGQRLLRLLSVMTVHTIRLGRVPIPAALSLGRALSQTGGLDTLKGGLLEQIYHQVLKDFSEERRRMLQDFFSEVSEDQALVMQLTPDGMDLFNAQVGHRESVSYGSVASWSPRPRPLGSLQVGLSPGGQATHAIYRALHRLASNMSANRLELDADQRIALRRAFERAPEPSSNDAIVPTLSQAFGQVIHAARADHLDVIGHFRGPDHQPPHVDWLRTLSAFDRGRFEHLWDDVVDFMLSSVADDDDVG